MGYKIEFDSDLFNNEITLDELPITQLSSLRFILYNLPKGINYTLDVVNKDGEEYDHIDEYVDDRIEEFFDIPDEMYESIVGKCFMNSDQSIVVKVVGLTDSKIEFLYEMYKKSGKGETSWRVKDHNWLQDLLNCKYTENEVYKKYKSYALTGQTDMNVCGEEMFHVGKDGNLYVDTTCGDDYDVYTPIQPSTFELIKAVVLENYTKD